MRRILVLSLLTFLLTGCGSNQDPYKDMSAEQLYEKGKQAALEKKYGQAINYYDALEAHYPYGEYTDKGQLALIHAYAYGNEEASALAAADRFIRMHPRHPHVDFAYYMKGVVNYNENYSLVFRALPLDRSLRSSEFAEQGFDDFKTLIEKFPDSQYAADARKRMIVLREQMANHNLSIAEYYMRQGADLAAANRAGFTLNQFSQTSAAPKALTIMHKAYTAMGMTKEASEAKKMLDQNFPNYKGEKIVSAQPEKIEDLKLEEIR